MADKTPTSGMKYLFIAGGRRKGAGGPKSYEIEREMRQKRIWIPRAFMIDGKNGFQNDATFFPNLAQSSLEATSKCGSHTISHAICSIRHINNVPGFDQDFLPLSSTPITDKQCLYVN